MGVRKLRVFCLVAALSLLVTPVWAANALEEACDAGDAIACNNWGHELEHGDGVAQDKVQARQVYERACSLGQAHSCSNVGLFLQDGRGGETDHARALIFLEKGCDGGDPKGCAWVAKIHRDVVGYKNAARAAEYARIGCDMRDANACVWLGIAYEDGAGVLKDIRRAIDEYSRACDLAEGMGCYNAALVLKSKRHDTLGDDRYKLANELAEKGCLLDHSKSCETVAYSLQTGRAVAKDLTRARALYEQTCKQDSGLGCSNLSKMLESGEGGAKNVARALELRRRACDLGYAKAC